MNLAAFLPEVGYWTLVVLGVGLLIFIHEAGHFLAAKAFKVKVLVFSLGFGPVITGFQRGDTHYRVSLVPLGGYVRMSGEYEQEGGGYLPDDLPSKPIWQRAVIMLAGVVMNAVLAVALYGASFAAGVPLDPARLGTVVPGKPAWTAGLRPGDLVLSADGDRILEFADLQHATLAGEPVELTVERDGATSTVTVTPTRDEGFGAPTIGVTPSFGKRFAVAPGSDAEKAGFRDGDTPVAVEGVPTNVDRLFLDGRYQQAVLPDGGPMTITVRRDGVDVDVVIPPTKTRPMVGIAPWRSVLSAVRSGGAAEAAGLRPGDRPRTVGGDPVAASAAFTRAVMRAPRGPLAVEVDRDGSRVTLALPADPAGRLDVIDDLDFAPDESPVRVEVLEEVAGAPSPALAAGIPQGARILAVGDVPVAEFAQASQRIAEIGRDGAAAVRIRWTDGDAETVSELKCALVPSYIESLPAGLTSKDDRPTVRITAPGELLTRAAGRFDTALRQVLSSLTGMFTGTVDRKNLGGVILIGQVARNSAEDGPGRFLWILAMLSTNLAVLNLLPIPLLDGGQLALLGLEAVLGKPPSEGIIVASQWVGLLLILGLMGLGFVNDIGRLIGQ